MSRKLSNKCLQHNGCDNLKLLILTVIKRKFSLLYVNLVRMFNAKFWQMPYLKIVHNKCVSYEYLQ
jgi:hypothetical protein